MGPSAVPSDVELVGAARAGDAAGLGLLLERHRPGMRAVALNVLGWGPDAEDAVQEATLIGLSRLGELRDPSAAGPWLRAITRNAALMLRRSTQRQAALRAAQDPPSPDLTPEQVLDDHALREWVWTAISNLSEPLRVAVILRYFTSASSYEQIAAVCEVPIGTVRSRLNQARTKLDLALRATSEAEHTEVVALTARRRRDVKELLTSAEGCQLEATLAAASTPDLLLIGPQGQRARGRDLLPRIMDADLQAGVRQRLNQVFAGGRITILESDLLNPPWDPDHCPPAVLWLMSQRDDRIAKIRLFHPNTAQRQLTSSSAG